MKQDIPSKIMSLHELEQRLEQAAKPIDFDALIKDGIIKKRGAWYEVLKPNKLPKDVLSRAIAAQDDPTGKKGLMLKFRRNSAKQAANALAQLRTRKQHRH